MEAEAPDDGASDKRGTATNNPVDHFDLPRPDIRRTLVAVLLRIDLKGDPITEQSEAGNQHDQSAVERQDLAGCLVDVQPVRRGNHGCEANGTDSQIGVVGDFFRPVLFGLALAVFFLEPPTVVVEAQGAGIYQPHDYIDDYCQAECLAEAEDFDYCRQDVQGNHPAK